MKRNSLTVYQRTTIPNPAPFPRGRPKTTNPGLKEIVYRLAALPQDSGWVEYVHPEGKPYFRHTKDKVVTESDITKPSTRKIIEYASKTLFQEKGLIDSEVELYFVLDPHLQGICHYYFADHAAQRVFWPDNVDPLDYEFAPPKLEDTTYGEFVSSASSHCPPQHCLESCIYRSILNTRLLSSP